ncbi:MAG: hypothetical protein CMD05_06400 [Flavobacteriales bacterium]|nr:hypothetical protein [Flavobacteriales bacterium]
MLKNLPFIISVAIVAIILFQSILIAPAINKFINIKEASVILRFIWPVFFIIISVLSVISILSMYIIDLNQTLARLYMIVSLGLMISCYFITPIINNAKDTSNDQLWTILHLFTIIATAIALLVNILNIIYWEINK